MKVRKLLAIAVGAMLALPGLASAQQMTKLKAGMVTGVVAVVLIVAVIGFAWVKLRR